MTPPGASAAEVIELLPDRAAGRTETILPAVFTAAVAKASAQALEPGDLITATQALASANQPALVQQLYKSWLAHNPDHPSRHVILFNYGVTLSDAGDLAAARDAFLEAIALQKDFLPPCINMGVVLERMGATDQAIIQWYHVANAVVPVDGNAIGYKTVALKQIARVLESRHATTAQAEDALRLSLEINPHQREPIQHWIFLRQGQCKWPVMTPWASVTRPAADGELLPAVAGLLRR